MTDTQLARPKFDWRSKIDERAETFAKSLPNDIPVEQFLAVCKESARRIEGLEECLRVNPASAFGAFLACARDGLIPDGKQAHIDVRYCKHKGKQASYMPMMRGIVDRLHRSSKIISVQCKEVYEGDDFKPDLSEDGHIRHIPKFETTELTHVYCIIKTTDGGRYRDVMGIDAINKRRASATTQYVWKKWPEEMAKKTILHNIAKILPLTSDDRRMIQHVETFSDLNREVLLSEPAPVLLDISDSGETEVTPPPIMSAEESIWARGIRAADNGVEALEAFYNDLNDDDKALVGEVYDTTWFPTAKQAEPKKAEVA